MEHKFQIGQFSDKMPIMHSKGDKKKLCDSEFSAPKAIRIPASNKVIETNDRNPNKGVIQRLAFGRYKNIYLSRDEYDQLSGDYPGRIDRLVEEMSAYCAANGKAYQNCEAALRSWAEKGTRQDKKAGKSFENYSCKEGESF